jgi:pilus assembly protein CpaF
MRKVVRVTEVLGTDPAPYATQDVFGYRQLGVRNGLAFGEFYSTGYRPKVLERLAAMGISLPDDLFRERVWKDA